MPRYLVGASKKEHLNTGHLQLKIYRAVLGKNWVKVDVAREVLIDIILNRKLSQTYSDYPWFKIKVENVEETKGESAEVRIKG